MYSPIAPTAPMGRELGNLVGCLLRARDEITRRHPGLGVDKLVTRAVVGAAIMPPLLWRAGPGGSLADWLLEAPRSFVLKHARGWSSRDVYCLTQWEGHRYEAIRGVSFDDADLVDLVGTPGDGAWFAEAHVGAAPRLPLDAKA